MDDSRRQEPFRGKSPEAVAGPPESVCPTKEALDSAVCDRSVGADVGSPAEYKSPKRRRVAPEAGE